MNAELLTDFLIARQEDKVSYDSSAYIIYKNMSINIPDETYKILIKRKYTRGNPHLSQNIHGFIEETVSQKRPIRLVGFWGVGPKEE